MRKSRCYGLVICLFSVLCVYVNAEEEFRTEFDKYSENKLLLIEARQCEVEENYTKAAKLYHKLGKLAKSTRYKADFFLKEADCLYEAEKTHKAFEAYRNLLQMYPLYTPCKHVVERLRGLAQSYIDGNGTFLGLRDKTSAIGIYYLILREAPAINVSFKDRETLAKLLVEEGRREEAVGVYQEILKLNPALDDARLEMAQLLVVLCKSGDGDGTKLRAASRHAKIILDRNPAYLRRQEAELIISEAREQEAERLLATAKFYLQSSHLRVDAAKGYLADLIKQFPGTKAAWEGKNLLDTHSAIVGKTAESEKK